jgi:hypothetical protein
MWLEETVWLWLPLIFACGAWTFWRTLTLNRELRSLRARVADLERANAASSPKGRAVA